MAPYVEQFPYEDETEIKRAGDARIFKVKRIIDGEIFAAKMRFNPNARPDLDYEGKIEAYKNFLGEVEFLRHSNHKNIGQMR